MDENVGALVPHEVREIWEIHEWRNALPILATTHQAEWQNILEVVRGFKLLRSDIAQGGGNKSTIARKLDEHFNRLGWVEKSFDTKISVDEEVHLSPTHAVDCFKGKIALEVEWNNKDPFFDRDLNNFRLLFDLRVIDVGVVITRCDELQEIFRELGRASSFGMNTTHMSQLLPRIEGGGGGGCPILVFGIGKRLYDETR